MSYATVAQIAEYLNQVPLDSNNTALLQSTLDRATAIVDDALGFADLGVAFATYTTGVSSEDIRGEGGEWLYLPVHEQGTVSAVSEVYSKALTSETTHVLTDWEEQTRPVSPLARLYRASGWGRRSWYRVTARWEYGPPPNDIVEVTLEVAINIWRARDAGRFSDVVGVEGSGAVGYERALTNQQRMVIDAVARRYGFGGVW